MTPADCPRPTCPVALPRAERMDDCRRSYEAAIRALARMKPPGVDAREWIDARCKWRTRQKMKMISRLKGRWEYETGRRFAFWNIPFAPTVPYPLRAACIGVNLNIFGFWWKPSFTNYRRTEVQKREGDVIWAAKWAWFQITYRRWM